MTILDIFSKRNKPLPDVYVYDELPPKLRAQIVNILRDTLRGGGADGFWQWLGKALAREHGLLDIPETPHPPFEPRDWKVDCLNYLLRAQIAEALDCVELTFHFIEGAVESSDYQVRRLLSKEDALAAIEELNYRFRENACGYQYENGCIMRVDSLVLHSAAVKPAMALLREKGFEGPNTEFMAAHEHFRHGRIEAAITEACKAFESTMKAICEARRWKYDAAKATASTLIKILIDEGLVPNYSDEQLRAVEKVLIGVATLRNKNSGHGAGSKPRDVPDHYAAYALHLAASNIVFLVECHKATRRKKA